MFLGGLTEDIWPREFRKNLAGVLNCGAVFEMPRAGVKSEKVGIHVGNLIFEIG